ncbi:MAG: SpoIIE family protein phosphatase, partial [Leptospiraceae bacterium]|nr:SpoIIE family protein phosphatase [Leptospiraceae bacterium]
QQVDAEHLSLRLGQINDRDVTYFNGRVIGRTGEWDAELAQAYDRTRVYDIPDNLIRPGSVNIILVHVQRFTGDEIGIARDEVLIGPEHTLRTELFYESFIEILFLAVYFTCGSYFLFLYVRRRVESENLIFGAFVYVMVAYQAIKTQLRWELDIPFVELKRVEYLLLYPCFPLFFYFFRKYFDFPRNRFMRIYDWLMLLPLAVLAGAWSHVLLTDDADNWWWVQRTFSQPTWLAYILGILGMLIYHTIRKERDALIMLIGFGFVFVGVVLDTLSNRGLFILPPVMSYVFGGFIISLALLLANRFVRVNEQVEDLNQNLEKKVTERTQQLNESLSEVRALKEQQDGDYFLTSLLIKPLGGNYFQHTNISVEMLTEQKKRFSFRHWSAEIGGDLNAAYELELRGRKYLAFLNGDAMGKSIQGAGGALVLGTVFKSVITRSQLTGAVQQYYPERWLKECFAELQNVFVSFDGYMLVSAVFGLLDADNGMLYYINAEHPNVILYRQGKAGFLQQGQELRKIGTSIFTGKLRVITDRLRPDDVLISGSDGRDDLQIGVDSRGHRIINEDEYRFVRTVETSRADLPTIWRALQEQGKITDDLALMRIAYREDAAAILDGPSANFDQHLEAARSAMEQKQYDAALTQLEQAGQYNPVARDVLLMRALCERKKKDFEKAARAYEQYLEHFPEDNDALFAAALMYKMSRNMEAAIDHGERLRMRHPDDVKNLVHLADAYRANRNYARAEKILSEALEIQADFPDALKLKEALQAAQQNVENQ